MMLACAWQQAGDFPCGCDAAHARHVHVEQNHVGLQGSGQRNRVFAEAFGKDPDFWVKASPTRQVKDSVPQMLLVCSSLRRLSCRQADAFALKAGAKAKVLPIALRLMPRPRWR